MVGAKILRILGSLLSDNDIKFKFISSLPERIEFVNYITKNELSTRLKLLKESLRFDHIEEAHKSVIEKMTMSYHDIFTLPGDPLPCTNLASHKILLKDEQIINLRQPRHPECHREEICNQVNDMLAKNIIAESNSPLNSPLWVVPKKRDASGKIKFRKINEKTDQDAYPLPVIDDILDHLGKARFFSAFDLSSGFHQIAMDKDSQKYTDFSTLEGDFQFNCMPFGLKNAPATFQRMMDTALRGLVGKTCFVYLDDIVVFGSTLQEHNTNLVTLFEPLRAVGLKLQPDKCEF